MTSVTEMGGIILPPVPAFYLHPESLDAVVDQIAARAVDLLRLAPPVAQAGRASQVPLSPSGGIGL